MTLAKEQAPEYLLTRASPLSFTQWQVWAVIATACLCGYLSLSIHFLSQDKKTSERLIITTASLAEPAYSSNAQRWLVEVNQWMPQLLAEHSGWNASQANQLGLPTSADVVAQITERTIESGLLSTEDRLALIRELHWLLSDLRNDVHQVDLSLNQSTHFYYLAVIGFVLALVGLYTKRRSATAFQGLGGLLQDQVLFENAPIALALSDGQDRVLRVNPAFSEITGFSDEEMHGYRAFQGDDALLGEQCADMYDSLSSHGTWSGEVRLRCKDGSVTGEKVTRIVLGETQSPEGFLTISMDAVLSDAEQKLMLWQAHHDNLTKLPNANLLHERMARALVAPTADAPVPLGALISVDLNKFQMVNDSIGHDKADRILMDAAYRIALSARETDTVARLGGDNFVILMQDLDDVGQAERVARSVVEAMVPPFFVDERELVLGVSVGLAIYPADGTEKGELLQKADAARLRAKHIGDNEIAFFEEDMNVQAARRVEIESHLRRAIAEGAFELHYQPIIDLEAQKIYGAEALLRWHSDELGNVSPLDFVPVAEESGLIKDLGLWVVAQVQKQLSNWAAQGLPNLRVSLNVSARQVLTEEDAQVLLDALVSSHRDSITVELTESALVNDNPGSDYFLRGLRQQGMRVALDDFGTGWSSVGYLRDYEFDVLKIDKSFIDGICEVRDHGLVASIVAMGRILGMKVVAEGVEDEAQLQQLERIGCDFVQGFHYSKPLPVDEFAAFVESWTSR